jgi:peptide subunit release factor RF-3
VLARVARRAEPEVYALRFVMISDVDRLTLMEHLDRECRESLELLHEVELSS